MAKKCEFGKKNGERCGADAQTGKGLCVFHDPARASEGRRARRAGGITRSRLATVLPADTPDYPLGNTTDVSAEGTAVLLLSIRGRNCCPKPR
jgi:hypothetical protein